MNSDRRLLSRYSDRRLLSRYSDRRLLPRYYFGLYHWRERGRRLALGVLAVTAGLHGLGRRSRLARLAGAALAVRGGLAVREAATALITPAPWTLGRAKYAALATELPLASADRLLDVGCGTGRSLVGLAPALPADCSVLGLDVFDDRIILGNAPGLARRNARTAGLDATALRGDAARLPVADDSVDVVTACRLLHDLSAADARRVLAEARRVCVSGGTVGVLALPYTHEATADPAGYWRDLVTDAGFTVTRVVDFEDDYTVVVGEA